MTQHTFDIDTHNLDGRDPAPLYCSASTVEGYQGYAEVVLNLEKLTVHAAGYYMDNGMLEGECNGTIIALNVSPSVIGEALGQYLLSAEFAELLDRVYDGYESNWDNNANLIGTLDSDAQLAVERIYSDLSRVPEYDVWDADYWSQYHGQVHAETSDEWIANFCEDISEAAAKENILLVGEHRLAAEITEYRDRLRKEAEAASRRRSLCSERV